MPAVKKAVLMFEVEDKPGALEEVLAAIAAAGIDLVGLIGYERAGAKARIYAMPKPGQGTGSFATVDAVIIRGADRVGSAAKALESLAAAGVNLRACMAVSLPDGMVIGCVVDDADAALAALA